MESLPRCDYFPCHFAIFSSSGVPDITDYWIAIFAHYLCMQVMKEWLESIVDALQDGAAENQKNQLVSAVCVTHCLRKSGIFNIKLDKFALPLVRMLYLRPNLEKKDCPDYQYLCDFLPKQHRYLIIPTVGINQLKGCS